MWKDVCERRDDAGPKLTLSQKQKLFAGELGPGHIWCGGAPLQLTLPSLLVVLLRTLVSLLPHHHQHFKAKLSHLPIEACSRSSSRQANNWHAIFVITFCDDTFTFGTLTPLHTSPALIFNLIDIRLVDYLIIIIHNYLYLRLSLKMLTPFAKKDVIDWREFLESESEKNKKDVDVLLSRWGCSRSRPTWLTCPPPFTWKRQSDGQTWQQYLMPKFFFSTSQKLFYYHIL